MADEGYFQDERKETEKADVLFKTKTPHEDCPVEALEGEVLLRLVDSLRYNKLVLQKRESFLHLLFPLTVR